MATISKDGISPGKLIKSDHLIRIINALAGSGSADLILSGSVTVLGGITGSLQGFSSSAFIPTYGVFSDTTTQLITSSTEAFVWTFNTTESARNMSIVSGSQITVTSTGVYNIQFSAQIEKTDAGDDECTIWFRKNGQDITRSATDFVLHSNNAKHVASWNYVESMNAGDYFEIVWSSADTNMYLHTESARTNPVRPVVPSLILTVVQVS